SPRELPSVPTRRSSDLGKVDLGQGISTALAQIAAEELGVPLEKVCILPASTAYSPDEGVTSGSLSIQDGGKGLRKACAELRELRSEEHTSELQSLAYLV